MTPKSAKLLIEASIVLCAALLLSSCTTTREDTPPAGTKDTRTTHYEDGSPKERVSFDKQGRMRKVRAWYPNGVQRVEALFDSDGNRSKYTSWFDNGNMNESVNYRKGQRAKATAFYRNGKIKKKEEYAETGERTSYVRYDENGKIVEGSRMINATGAVIVKQTSSHFYYKKKCNACGFLSDRVIGTAFPKAGGAISTTFACPKCKKVQKVRINVK